VPELSWKIWLAIGIGALVVVGVMAFPTLARMSTRNGTEAELRAAQTRLDEISINGGDPVEAERLRARIRELTTQANAYGATFDLGAITLDGCQAMYARIESEWNNYVATVTSDPLKRNNTRASILNFGTTLARCYEQAVTDASDRTTLEAIRAAILQAFARSEARRICFETDGPGCGRSGVSEDHGFDKAAAERDVIQAGLRRALNLCNSKLTALGGNIGSLA
jgi:hypothetical protein